MTNRLDIIVFGATGFTSKYIPQHLYKFSKSGKNILTWGVAGRSEAKLKNVLDQTAKRIGIDDLNDIPIIIADTNDEDSIVRMTSQARIIINCCGPYDFYGEVVIRACMKTITHHVDISAEPQFVHSMLLKYRKDAEDKGIYIVNACGFDSVPADLGMVFLEKHFEGTLNSVQIYIYGYNEKGFVPGSKGHYTTWKSMVNSLRNYWNVLSLRKKLYPNGLPTIHPKLLKRFVHKMSNKWAMPFPAADYDVITRSQMYSYENEGKRPIQVECYLLRNSLIDVLFNMFLVFICFVLAQFKFGSNLLLQYPEFFSNGLFSHSEPSENVLKYQRYYLTMYGKGWNEKIVDCKCKTPPNKTIVGRVRLPSISGHDYTALAFTLCAITILNESEHLPVKGGIYTPGVAFSRTSLTENLQKSGTVFEILSNEED